ncbi:MAG: AraC-like DNA-binding protein [Crocinitomix sp.]|jgi:AraC-like DNA-binding protein
MIKKLKPEINKVYFINKFTLIHVLSGHGIIQVDFKNYADWQDKAIYLEKGQYIKFLSDDFVVRKIEFPNEMVFRNKEVRVLFKHLISLGYIDFKACEDCQRFIGNGVFADNPRTIIDISSKQWYWQNPFQASKEEYQIIFDIKDIIDDGYTNFLNTSDVTDLMNAQGIDAQALIKNKIGLSIQKLLGQKRLIESKKEIAFTDRNIQEISNDLGFSDAAYFNRVFKKNTGQTPREFRNNFDYTNRDQFTQDIIEILQKFHNQERSLDFYAGQFNLSVKALSKKVKQKMNTSLGQLIRMEIIKSAKNSLLQGGSVLEVAYLLKFEEPQHFSSFFKKYTGLTPTEFKKSNL